VIVNWNLFRGVSVPVIETWFKCLIKIWRPTLLIFLLVIPPNFVGQFATSTVFQEILMVVLMK
jgi:hypothetical protein